MTHSTLVSIPDFQPSAVQVSSTQNTNRKIHSEQDTSLQTGSSFWRSARCCCPRRRPPPPAAAGSGWSRAEQPQPALVTEASGTCHLFEQVCRKEKDTRGQALLPGCGKEPRFASFPRPAGAVSSLGGHEHKYDFNLAAPFPINTVKCEPSGNF